MARGKDGIDEEKFMLEFAVALKRTIHVLRRHSFLLHVDWQRVCELHDHEQSAVALKVLCKRGIRRRQIEGLVNPTARTSFNAYMSSGSIEHQTQLEREVAR